MFSVLKFDLSSFKAFCVPNLLFIDLNACFPFRLHFFMKALYLVWVCSCKYIFFLTSAIFLLSNSASFQQQIYR